MPKKKVRYPDKTTLNLVIRQRPANFYPRLVLGILVLCAAVGAFSKLAVADRLAGVNRAWREVELQELRLKELTAANADFAQVRLEYDRSFAGRAEARAAPDAAAVLELIEARLMPAAQLGAVELREGTLAVELLGIDLERASVILQSLYESPLVDTVELYTASTEQGAASISMTIGLAPAEGGETP